MPRNAAGACEGGWLLGVARGAIGEAAGPVQLSYPLLILPVSVSLGFIFFVV